MQDANCRGHKAEKYMPMPRCNLDRAQNVEDLLLYLKEILGSASLTDFVPHYILKTPAGGHA